jgi:hypothetical protein
VWDQGLNELHLEKASFTGCLAGEYASEYVSFLVTFRERDIHMKTACGKNVLRVALLLIAVDALTGVGLEAADTQALQKKADFAISSDGVRIAYEVHGEGSPALVFVHGWSCDRSYWAGQFEPFSRQFKVVAVDLAGHGDSGLERRAWTIQSFGDDVASVVKKLRLGRVILIGHSMGWDVIPEAARATASR